MAYAEIDLSTATFPDGTASYSGGSIVGSSLFNYFHTPTVELDPAKTYQFQIDYTGATSVSQLNSYSQLSPDVDGYDNSHWADLINTTAGELPDGAGQVTATIGPALGAAWYEWVYQGGEHFVIWEWRATAMSITGMRWQEIPGPALPPDPVVGSDAWQTAGLLYLGVTSEPTPQASLTVAPDEPDIPGPDAWLGAGSERSAWWKLQPLDAVTWISVGTGFSGTGYLEVYYRSAEGWVRKITTSLLQFDFKANVGVDYYIRVSGLVSDTTSDLNAALAIDATPAILGWRQNFFEAGGEYTAPMGASMASAPLITLGSYTNSVTRNSARDPAFEHERGERSADLNYEGWYKFVADKTGLVLLRTGSGTLSLWTDGPELIGARQNIGGTAQLIADVEEGVTYYIRACGDATTSPVYTYKIAAVAHGYAPMTDVARYVPAGSNIGKFTTSLDSEKAVLDLLVDYPTLDSGPLLSNFALAAIPIPVGAGDGTGALGYMADVRFIQDAVSNVAKDDFANDGLSFDWYDPPSGNRFYWPMDWLWQPTVRREHYISLFSGGGSFVMTETMVVNGTWQGAGGITGTGFQLTGWNFPTAGEQVTVYLTGTRMRASWFVDDEPLDDDSPLIPSGTADLVTRRHFEPVRRS